MLKPEMVYHILVYVTTFSHFRCSMTVPVWLCRDKKNPPPDVEAELMMEAWRLLKNEEEGGPLLLPAFPLIIKQEPTKFSGQHPLAHPQASQAS